MSTLVRRCPALGIVLCFALSITSPAPAQNPLREILDQAEKAEEAGDLRQAEWCYRKLLFVKPGYSKAKRGLDDALEARAEKLIAQADALDDDSPLGKADLLRKAYQIDPQNRDARQRLEELGWELEDGIFRQKDGAGLAKASAKDEASARRQELGLPDTFEMIRKGPFRFFTNVNVRDARSVIEQMINSNLTHYREYCRIMAPFGLNTQVDTIDLVLFDTPGEYHRHVRMPGSAGVYVPAQGAGFFYRDGGYNFSTMLHEMTHQLNHKVLGAYNHGWYEEGISEYFGAASMTQGGKRMKLGIPDGHRYARFKDMVRDRGTGGFTPLDRFVRQRRASLTSEYYAQAWALTFYLMEHHPYGRLILFDYVASTSGLSTDLGIEGTSPDLEAILKTYGFTLDEFEKGLLKHYREG